MTNTKIKDFISSMKNSDIEVNRINMVTESWLKRMLNKNKGKIEEILIVMKQGEKIR